MAWNRWPASPGMGGRLAVESVAGIAWNTQNTDTNENLYIRFKENDYIYPVRIPAGNYSLQSIAFFDQINQMDSEESIQNGKGHSFRVVENVMYYIGDYRGQIRLIHGLSSSFSTWDAGEIQDNFSSTTSKLVEIYPGLSKLDTINALDRN